MSQCEVTEAGFVCIYPLLTSRVSLGGPGPMPSFSEWEKLLQARYTTQSVVCAMMWQLASIHGSSMVCPYLLVICWHHPLAKQTASHPQRAQPDSYFPAGVILATIWVEFSMIELPNPLKSVRHCKLPKRQTSRVTLLNSLILVTIRLSHSSSSQYWHHDLQSKEHLHWGSAEGRFLWLCSSAPT